MHRGKEKVKDGLSLTRSNYPFGVFNGFCQMQKEYWIIPQFPIHDILSLRGALLEWHVLPECLSPLTEELKITK